MKFVHISDLHIGKRVNEFSMLEDQQYILLKILNILDDEKTDALVIAGDVYDKSQPSAEAVALFDDFLRRAASRNIEILIISGNHDSPERLAFGSELMKKSGVHISRVYDGSIEKVTMRDDFGEVDFYLLPFVKTGYVRRFYPDEPIETTSDALRVALSCAELDKAARNVLVAHQFVTGAARCESEETTVGGADNVDAAVFDDFDYVALGHLHSPQSISREIVRYCGTPLKYSFSEAKDQKSVTVVELFEKGNVKIREIPLTARRDLREIRGSYEEVTDRRNYEGTNLDDYIRVTLTDEEDVFDAVGKLRAIYKNIMKLDYDNKRTRSEAAIEDAQADKPPLELFSELFEAQNGAPMSEEQTSLVKTLIEKIWESRSE